MSILDLKCIGRAWSDAAGHLEVIDVEVTAKTLPLLMADKRYFKIELPGGSRMGAKIPVLNLESDEPMVCATRPNDGTVCEACQ